MPLLLDIRKYCTVQFRAKFINFTPFASPDLNLTFIFKDLNTGTETFWFLYTLFFYSFDIHSIKSNLIIFPSNNAGSPYAVKKKHPTKDLKNNYFSPITHDLHLWHISGGLRPRVLHISSAWLIHANPRPQEAKDCLRYAKTILIALHTETGDKIRDWT